MHISHLTTALLVPSALALQLPHLQPFWSALSISLEDYIPPPPSTTPAPDLDLRKRQYSNTCPTSYKNCANLGASNLCCAANAICSADFAGHVACCPSGAACSGTISGVITSGTVDPSGNLIGGGGAIATTTQQTGLAGVGGTTTTQAFQTATTTGGNGLVVASTQPTVGTDSGQATGSGFVLVGSSTVATPGAGMRRAEVPMVIRGILRVLEYIPL